MFKNIQSCASHPPRSEVRAEEKSLLILDAGEGFWTQAKAHKYFKKYKPETAKTVEEALRRVAEHGKPYDLVICLHPDPFHARDGMRDERPEQFANLKNIIGVARRALHDQGHLLFVVDEPAWLIGDGREEGPYTVSAELGRAIVRVAVQSGFSHREFLSTWKNDPDGFTGADKRDFALTGGR